MSNAKTASYHVHAGRGRPACHILRRCGRGVFLYTAAKPLLRTRLTESTESLAIDLVYVLQDEQYTSDS